MPKRRRAAPAQQQDDEEYDASGYPAAGIMTSDDPQSQSETLFPDANSSTRRILASVACNACRTRKSKCDEQWPVCGACSRLNLRCKYEQRRKSKIDSYLETISDSLQQLQRNTNHLTSRLAAQGPIPDSSPASTGVIVCSPSHSSHVHSEYGPTGHDKQPARQPLDLDFPHFRHLTASHELYTWPKIARALPGADLTYPVTCERTRKPLSSAIVAPHCLASSIHNTRGDWWDAMNISQVRTLLNHYFDDLYQVYPIIEKRKLLEFAALATLERGFNTDHESCVIFLALALGSFIAYHQGETEWGHEGMDDTSSPVGIGFFNKARQILAFLPKGQVGTAQCHVLAGLYYAQLIRVYDFWASIHDAAVTFFNIISTSAQEKDSPDVTRGYWVTYILECTILSEVDLRPSGLYQLQDAVTMTFGRKDTSTEDHDSETEWQFVFLANIALRRLFNRAYRNWLGSVENGTANPSVTVNHELAHQLDDWFHHLPPSIAAQMNTDETRNRARRPGNLLGLLRGRYSAAKFNLYRPYVYKALHSPPEALTADDIAKLQQCLEAGMKVPQEIGLLTETARLVVSPFAPIRSFMSTYTLLCAVQDVPHLRHYAIPALGIAEEIRQKISVEFKHLSPLVQRDMELLDEYIAHLGTTQGMEYS